MDEEMGEVCEGGIADGFEIDLDYEFDAPQYFDLSGEEPLLEATGAERWFETAESYPPSPLIMKIQWDQGASLQEDSEEAPSTPQPNLPESNDHNQEEESSRVGENKPKIKTKFPFFKGSTLMKPTASHLAKQIHRTETRTVHRNNRLKAVTNLGACEDMKDCSVQAAKRQRLEKGHLSKGIGQLQADLIHKIRDKNDLRLKTTVPIEPDLQTMRRAERFKARRGLDNGKQLEQDFNSNRKEFDSMHKSRSENKSSRNIHINSENRKPEESKANLFKFRAANSDKKVMPSSVTKLNTTIPKAFNLSFNRRCQPPPLTEIFNKLAITTEAKHASSSKSGLPKMPISKDSKENIRRSNLH